jgi:hypothetical protein
MKKILKMRSKIYLKKESNIKRNTGGDLSVLMKKDKDRRRKKNKEVINL